MIKITIVVPYKEIYDFVSGYVGQIEEEGISFDITHFAGYERVMEMKLDADVIIARGMSFTALKEYHRDITAVELSVSGYDVISALAECKNRFNPKKVAIIGSGNMIYGSDSLKSTLNVDIQCYTIEKEREAKNSIQKALEDGADAFVTGFTAFEIANSMGLNAVHIKTGKEAVKIAIDEAVRVAVVKQKEQERAELFRTILNSTHEAIVAVDGKGNLTAFNRAAYEIIKPEESAVEGMNMNQVLKNTGLLRILEKDTKEVGIIETVNDVMIAANRVPIKVRDVKVGAVATFQNVRGIQEVENQIRKKIHSKGLSAKYNFDDIIGNSQSIMSTIEKAYKFSQVDSNIMLLGETGVGKELFAQSIHNCSKRSKGPFVAINCAALAENLLESELFGYVDGAFTGAAKGGKMGLFELAHTGTIFLDEIGEVSLSLQSKLLRVLQEREIMRIGHDRITPVDVRIISATNKNLRQMVRENSFRNDILYRLDVLKVNIPPLRERKEDITLIFNHYLKIFNEKHNKNIHVIGRETEERLHSYGWPGNVRELVNVCERAVVLTEGDRIEPGLLEDILDKEENCTGPLEEAPWKASEPEKEEQPEFENIKMNRGITSIHDSEKKTILNALEACKGCRTETAKMLGISRATLWRKLRGYGRTE